jgi:FKBP-type peptidyl-prolyl cis-trans isomerase
MPSGKYEIKIIGILPDLITTTSAIFTIIIGNTPPVFDSSLNTGRTPLEFYLTGVIDGWKIGVPLIQKGGKIRLIIPSGFAYGPSGAGGGAIGPNAVLDFDIEIIDIR